MTSNGREGRRRRRHIPVGSTVIRIRLFDAPGTELARTLRPPWPSWMEQLYEMQRLGGEDFDPAQGEAPLSAAILAAAERLGHRLQLIAWLVDALHEKAWHCYVEDDSLVATKVILPQLALEELETAGVLGPMSNVCELDEHGFPQLLGASEL